MARNLLRNVRIFASTVTTGWDDTNTWELAIQDDFSYSQGNETQEITVAEAGATPVRGQAVFNTALNPVEWTFSTYIRPFLVNSGHGTTAGDARAVENIMWHALVSSNGTAPNWDLASAPIDGSTAASTIDFSLSNAHELTLLNLYVLADGIWYLVQKAQVNQAEVDFGIDAIAMITWSGNGTLMNETATHPVPATTYITSEADGCFMPSQEADYIKNRLTTLVFTDNDNDSTEYTIAITGGNLTINNNITYLTPDTLSVVDKPIGSFTGTRQINGNLTCYLNSGTTNSATLLKDMLTQSTSTNTSYQIEISLGGATYPKVEFNLPTAHVTIPNTEVADVIGLSIDFYAQGSLSPIDDTDEMTVIYTPFTEDARAGYDIAP